MATPSHDEPRRLYSWWWDSHIIPKHSKWLQDNLVDMDDKIKAMISLLEEDADSFARKAEMYYKKRPELIKLAEEFFRAYRGLAERYDHVTGALRQAHRTIADAFPNQILLDFFDEYISSEDAAAATPSEDATGSNFAEDGNVKFSEYKLLQKEISRLSNENQDLMKQIALESARADTNESEVQRLKEINSKVKSEKEDSSSRYLESLTRVSDLETEISRTTAELQKLNDDIIIGTSVINSAEERNLDLENANRSLQLELGIVKRKIQQQQEQLNKKGEELQILSSSLQDEHQKSVMAEMACQSMENQHIESLEEMTHLKQELRIGVEKLKDMEKELQKIRGENLRLREHKLSSALKIMSLQDEMISLLDLKRKLEDEADFHIEEKEALDLQLNHLRKDRNELERKYSMLTNEIQAVNSAVESLQALIKDLRDANLELRGIIKNNEDERNLYLQNLDHTQTMSEKISALEAALLEANEELERVRMKIKELEDSSAYLHCRISIHLAEKAALLSQMEASAQNMDHISKKNIFLENSLSDVNLELEDLRIKLKGAEESCRSLRDEKPYLQSERSTLISQVENLKQTLRISECRYCVLENKSSNLEMEKDVMLHQIEEMQELLRVEKDEHTTLLQSSTTQLSAFANQICLLQDQGRQREEYVEMEHHQILSTQIEIFVLQRCLRDLILSCRSQENRDALQCKEKLILELEQQCLTQQRKIKSLTDRNNTLRDWIHVIIRNLKMDLEHASLVNTEDEILLQLIFHEIKQLLRTISESRDEKQHLLLEKSVVVTLLQQFGKYVTDIKAEGAVLDSESKIKEQNLVLLKCKNDEFLELNEHLRNDVQARKQREEALKSEVDLLFRQLKCLQDSYGALQKENDWLYRKLCHLKEEKAELEEDHNATLAECMALDCLSVVLRGINLEREFAPSLLSNGRTDFYKVKNNLETDNKPILEKLVMLEVENTHLKVSFANLKEQRISLEFQHAANYSEGINKLSLQRDTGGDPLIKRDTELVQSNLSSKEINLELSRYLNDPKVNDNEATVTRGLGRVSAMSNDYANMKVEIESLQQANKDLTCELCEIQKDMGELLHDIQFETINAVVYKEKVLELIRKNENFEICALVQTEVSQEEITLRDSTISELEKKIQILEVENIRCRADLNDYSLFLGTLWDDITILEDLTLSLMRRHSTSVNQKSEDDQIDFCPDIMSIQEQMKDHSAKESVGPLKLQVLRNKVKLLQEVLLTTGSILEMERIDSSVSLDAAWREIEGLKLKGILDNEIAESNYEHFMKDIQLDIALNPSRFRNIILSNELRKPRETNEADEQILDLCGTYEEEGCSYTNQEGPLVTENDMAYCEVEEVESNCISDEMVTEKELGIDKLEPCQKIEPHQEWNRMVIERLFSDARRLVLLRSSVQDLQKSMEISEKISQPTRLESNTIKVQLKEAEGTISELVEVNGKLTKKMEDLSTSPDDNAEKKDRRSKLQKQVSSRAQKVSEKIGRLELEMHKLKYNLLKFEEDQPNKRPRIIKRRPVVRLREYIYGRRNSMRQRKGSSCGCIRPAENSD